MFSIQELDFERSVCMTAISYSRATSTVLMNERLFGEKWMCAKLQIDISQTERLVRIYTDRQTSHCSNIFYIGSSTFPSGFYKLRGKLNTHCLGYKND